MIYSLTVHTYRYFLFGETFESDEDGAFGYSSLSCVFFQKFQPDIILWEGRGKMIFPPNYIARACVRNWGLSLLSPLSLLGRAGMNCHL